MTCGEEKSTIDEVRIYKGVVLLLSMLLVLFVASDLFQSYWVTTPSDVKNAMVREADDLRAMISTRPDADEVKRMIETKSPYMRDRDEIRKQLSELKAMVQKIGGDQ